MFRFHEQSVAHALVIALAMVMGGTLGDGAAQRLFPEEDHAVEALGRD